MAALIGDVFADPSSRFHGVIRAHSHDIHCQARSVSRSRGDRDAQPHHTPRPTASPRGRQPSAASVAAAQAQMLQSRREWDEAAQEKSTRLAQQPSRAPAPAAAAAPAAAPAPAVAARLPSPPPSSSSSSESSSAGAQPRHEIPRQAPPGRAGPPSAAASASSASSTSTATTVKAPPSRSIPSPDSDGGPAAWAAPHAHAHAQTTASSSSIPRSLADPAASPMQTQTTIRVRDLAHIQSLARADLLGPTGPGILNDPPLQQMKYEISGMPIGDIIEMVAALLTKITTTNDLQHDALNRNAHHLRQAQAQARRDEAGAGAAMSPLSSSVLAFHGKNVPAITILSYLTRIHKYCPTTYEVFLSLLVYFDRMTERVNDMVMKSEEARRRQLEAALRLQQQQKLQQRIRLQQTQPAVVDRGPATPRAVETDRDIVMRDRDADDDEEDHGSDGDETETDSELADEDDDDEVVDEEDEEEVVDDDDDDDADADDDDEGAAQAAAARGRSGRPPASASAAAPATYFVVDSFNIHRLIIAGVTCASKFFSDVFYTNSRYAKVCCLLRFLFFFFPFFPPYPPTTPFLAR